MSMSLEDTNERKPVVESGPVTVVTNTIVESEPTDEAPPAPIDEEELKRLKEQERLEQEGLDATFDSIFTLPDDDEVRPHSFRK